MSLLLLLSMVTVVYTYECFFMYLYFFFVVFGGGGVVVFMFFVDYCHGGAFIESYPFRCRWFSYVRSFSFLTVMKVYMWKYGSLSGSGCFFLHLYT